MNRVSTPLMMIVPVELLGLIMTGMIMLGGIFIMFSATRKGKAIIFAALMIPVALLVAQALMDSFFAALPDGLIQPVSWLITGIIYLATGWALFRALVGERVIREAQSRLLADFMKWLARQFFKWPVVLMCLGGLAYLYLSVKLA